MAPLLLTDLLQEKLRCHRCDIHSFQSQPPNFEGLHVCSVPMCVAQGISKIHVMTYSATKPSADRSHWHHQLHTLYLHHLHKVIVCNPLGICTNGYLEQSKWQPLDIPLHPADFNEWTIGAKASWAAWRRIYGDLEPCKNCCGSLLTKLFQVWLPICPLLLLMLELIHLLLMPEGLISEMNVRGSILPACFQRAFDSIVGTIFLPLFMSRCRNPPTSWGGRFSRKIISIQSVQGSHIYLSCQTLD